MGNWLAQHDLSCWQGRKTSTQTKTLLFFKYVKLSLTYHWIPTLSEPPHGKTNKMICATSKDSDQPGYPPSLIRVLTVRSVGSWGSNISSCRQLIRVFADAQADLSFCWAHKSFCWFCREAAQLFFWLVGGKFRGLKTMIFKVLTAQFNPCNLIVDLKIATCY